MAELLEPGAPHRRKLLAGGRLCQWVAQHGLQLRLRIVQQLQGTLQAGRAGGGTGGGDTVAWG